MEDSAGFIPSYWHNWGGRNLVHFRTSPRPADLLELDEEELVEGIATRANDPLISDFLSVG